MPTPLFSNILIVSQGSLAKTMAQLRTMLWGSCAHSEITHMRYPQTEMKPACRLLLITKFNSPHLNRSLWNFGYYLHKWQINTLWQWHVYCAWAHLNKLEDVVLTSKTEWQCWSKEITGLQRWHSVQKKNWADTSKWAATVIFHALLGKINHRYTSCSSFILHSRGYFQISKWVELKISPTGHN